MSLFAVILRLVTAALLITYLLMKVCRRERSWSEPKDPTTWTATPIDATKLIASMDRVRHDYLAARHVPSHSIRSRTDLREVVRLAVSQMTYFRDKKLEDYIHDHAA